MRPSASLGNSKRRAGSSRTFIEAVPINLKFERIKFSPESPAENFQLRSESGQSIWIAIFAVILNPDANSIPLSGMRRWRSTMPELSAETRLHLYARSLSRRTRTGFHTAALYGAFALIAAVGFGTLAGHPFLPTRPR